MENDFGVEIAGNDYVSPSASITHQVSHLVKDNEVSDMELTNCETNVHASSGSPQTSLCLCSPESLLKPLRALETTVIHASQHMPCEHLAANDLLPNPTMNSCINSLPIEDQSKLTSVTMEFTCQDTAHLSINSDLNSICEVKPLKSNIHPPITRGQSNESNDEHSNCNLHADASSTIPVNVDTTAIHTPSQSNISSDQYVTRVPPHPLKLKQTPSKTMLLLASPYTETLHCEGIVHLDAPVVSVDTVHHSIATTNTCTNKSLVQGSDNQHILTDQENMWEHLNSSQSKEGEANSLHNSDIKHKPCHDHSSPVVSNDEEDISHHNWLEDSNHNGFALVPVGSSPASQMPASTVSQLNHDNVMCVHQPFALVVPRVDELTATPTTETNSSDETLVINSPQVVPVKYSVDPNVTGDFHSLSFIGDLSTSQGPHPVRQSLRMSPSVFSKFLTKLERDRSILMDSSNVENVVEDTTQDSVSVLSSSLACTHIASTSDRVNSDEDKDSSVTDQSSTGTFSALLEKLTKE